MADGSLSFDTKVDTTGFEDGTASLKSVMEKLTATIERLTENIVKAFSGAGESADSIGVRAEKSAAKVEEIGDAAKKAQSDVKSLEEQMADITVSMPADTPAAPETQEPRTVELNGDYKVYGQEVQQFVDDYVNGMNRANQHTNEFKTEIESLSAKLKEMESRGFYFGDDEYDETFMKLSKIKQALADYKREMLNPTPDVEVPVKLDMNSFEGQKQELKAQLAELESKGITLGSPDYDAVYVALQRVTQAEGEYKKALMGVDQAQKKAGKSAEKMKSSLKKTNQTTVPLAKSILKLSSMFKLMIIRMAMRAVIQAAREGFENLAQYSDGVNGTLSSLMSSLMYLKNSFAAAFAPVLDFVVPALNSMIDAIANVLAWIGQFMAALTGKSTFIKAKKTQEDYAESLKKTGGAAKDAGKDAKKSLAPFDELNNLAEQNSAGAGGGAGGTDPSNMFETVDVDSGMISMVEGIKQAFSDLLTWAQVTFGPSLSQVWNDMIPNIENFKTILAGMWSDIGTLGEPLRTWFNNDFVPLLQQIVVTGGLILNGLFESFNMVFSDIWNLAVFPVLSKFITVGLPMLTQFATEAVDAFGIWFLLVKNVFDRIWKDAIAPALELATKIWNDWVDILAEKWDEFGVPIFDAIKEAFEKTGEVWNHVWDNYLKPVFDTFMDVADRLWTNHVKPLLEHFIEFKTKLIQVGLDIYNHMILPLVKWFADTFGPGISNGVQIAIDVFGVMGVFISGVVDTILLVLNGVLDFIHTGFTQGWGKAWEGVGDIFRDVFNGIVQVAENAINFIVDSINSISFDVPEWVPKIGGMKFGFDLDHVRLPKLANGTVVPPRAGEFAAILGDNNRDTEIVSPVETMKQAFKDAVSEVEGLGGGDIYLVLEMDGDVMYEKIIRKNQQRKKQTGKNPMLV